MSEQQHTLEPWEFSRDVENDVEFNITKDNWYVAVCCDAPGNGMPESNARRIVACVNACKEIPNETLETLEFPMQLAGILSVIQQRDELLSALERLVIRCDGEQGMRADMSNIDTSEAHGIIARLKA